MRKIKFRGKSLNNGEWVCGDYHIRAGNVHTIIAMEPDKYGKVFYMVNQVIPDTVGQFTGLHDKSGNELYEGDIVANDFGNNNIVNMTVEWCTDGYWALHEIDGDDTMHFVADYLKEIEVIGNTHNNPELMKQND